MEYSHVIGQHWHWYWIVPFLFMILMIMLASRMCRRTGAWRGGVERNRRVRFGCCQPGHDSMAHRWSETPRQILDRRYAIGEITKEQYEQMRDDFEQKSSHSQSRDNS
jgi:putative membrane protein